MVAGLLVWTALSGVGTLSAGAGLFLGLLTMVMLSSVLVFFSCSGSEAEIEMPPEDEARFLPGWVMVIAAMALLVWIGLSGIGDLSGFAGFFFAFITMLGLTTFVIWSSQGGADEDDIGFGPVSAPATLDGQDAGQEVADAVGIDRNRGLENAVKLPEPVAKTVDVGVVDVEADPASVGAGLQQISGIGPAIEGMLNDLGVTTVAQIAAWDDAEAERIAKALGQWGGRLRNDDWIGQARGIIDSPEAGAA